MFELLVPAEQAQLELFEGDRKAYDLELRPRRLSVKRGSPARETARGPARGIPEEVGGRSVSSRLADDSSHLTTL